MQVFFEKNLKEKRENHEITTDEYIEWKLNYEIAKDI